jgi:hypothetical protein
LSANLRCLSPRRSHSRTRRMRQIAHNSEYFELSTVESYSRSTYTRSDSGTPLPSSSSERTPAKSEIRSEPTTTATPTSSTQYETARSPSIISFTSLLSIPSLYETAELRSTESETTQSVSSQDLAKASPTVESVSTSKHWFARVSRSRHMQLQRSVRQKC